MDLDLQSQDLEELDPNLILKIKIYSIFKYYYLTLRRFRWTSPGDDEGKFEEEDEEEYNPLPAFINGRWERRKESTLIDVEVTFNVFAEDGYKIINRFKKFK